MYVLFELNGSDGSAVGDVCVLAGFAVLGSNFFEVGEEVLAFDDFSEDDVLSVEPGALDESYKELGSVGVGTSVGHGEEAGLGVLQVEVLVLTGFSGEILTANLFP